MKDKLMKFYEKHKKLSIGMIVVFCLMVIGAFTGPADKNDPTQAQNSAIERSIPGDNSAANKADAANVTKAAVPDVVIVDATTAANKEAAEKAAQASREAAEQAKQAEITKSPKATTPKSITASVKGNHYIGDTLGSGDFTVYITMSDGATQTNPAGWSASPLTLSNASNQITVSYGELSTVITVAALTKSTPTVSQKGGSGGSSGKMVWIPTNGGGKYHSKSTCSKMIDPILVTEEEAIERGFDACKKCKP